MSVLLETSAGDLVIDLLLSESPQACLNFLKLCKCKYYNFAPFYNLQSPSFIQAGDPLYPIGDGGSSCWGLADPTKRFFKADVTRRLHERGSVSMVCSADGLCGSQFFLSLGANASLDKKHVIFGRLAEGFETLDAIAQQPVDAAFRPLRDIRIKHTIVLEDPFDDPPDFIGAAPESPLPSERQLSTMRLAYDEVVEEVGNADDIEARTRAREAEASALALEAMGDLPFASVRPPDNILFVCKLNPVTTSDDLTLIFGRFGAILSCQVVRDARTGDSLQYAFVEYDVKEDAERAYFKMQGVLIDDRRIHVDFSQSVARVSQYQPHEQQQRQRQQSVSRRRHDSRERRPRRQSPEYRAERDRDRDRDRHRGERSHHGRERESSRRRHRRRDTPSRSPSRPRRR